MCLDDKATPTHFQFSARIQFTIRDSLRTIPFNYIPMTSFIGAV